MQPKTKNYSDILVEEKNKNITFKGGGKKSSWSQTPLIATFNARRHSCCSVTQSCLTLGDPMDCSMTGFPVLHCLLEFAQIHAHQVSDAIQPSHPLSSPSPPAPNPSQHQSLSNSQSFASGSQSIGVSASASVLPMNIQA